MLTKPGNVALACALSALAGYVDGIGFIYLGGLFVSFMSGNSTRMGVSFAEGQYTDAATAAGLIALFVTGAAIGSKIALSRGAHRQSLVLIVEAALLAGAATAAAFGSPHAAVAAIVLAMGLENAVFQVGGGAAPGLTYVTGALVKAGQLLATALSGGARFGWAPHLALWAALVIGAAIGAVAYARFALAAIWFAAMLALVLAAILAVNDRRSAKRI